MTSLSIDEKVALEEVFIVLQTRKRRIELLRRYHLYFYNKIMSIVPFTRLKKGE